MKPIGFVYLTTNIVNGKIYVGQRRFLDDKKENADYIGSGGEHFKAAIKKYGRKNFKRRILKLCETSDELNHFEKLYSMEYNPNLDPKIGYNKFHGSVCDGDNPSRNEEVRKLQSLSAKKNRSKNGSWWTGKRHSEESRKKIAESNSRRKLSKESKEKMSDSLRRYWTEEKRQQKSEQMKGKISPRKGVKLSEETKLKISNSRKKKI